MMKDKIIDLFAGFSSGDIQKTFPLEYCLPVYHCVSDNDLPHIKNIIRYKNVKQFEEDLDCFSRHFQFVNWEEFKKYITGDFIPRKKIALLTFDDGFREFYDVVTPILERKGIYAVNFINPAFVDNKELMFRCKSGLMISELENRKKIRPEIFSILQLKEQSGIAVRQQILKINYKNRTLLDQIAEMLEIDFDLFLKEQKPYMSFEQLNVLTQKGFGISSHSWDHPRYNELSLEQQLESTNRCFDYLKKNNFLYDSFAFPFTDFGVEKRFFDELFKNKEMFCSFGSAGIKQDSIERNFHRIPMETDQSAEVILKKEIAYFRLKNFLNKNKIVRK